MNIWKITLAAGLALVTTAAQGADAKPFAEDECQRAVRMQRTDGADYTPGVDVHGRAVAPADLQPTVKIAPPRVIEFPVSVDVARRLGFHARGPYVAEAPVANVRIEDGRVSINGQPVNPDNTADLVAACRAARK